VASRTRFGDRLETRFSAPAVRMARRYPAGKTVTVRYNPHDAQEAVLEPGLNGLLLTAAAVSLLFLLSASCC
jgi:hypothetical protein